MYYKKIYAALLSISIFALVSCASYERVPKNESVQIIEAPILDNSSENIIQEGKINLIKYCVKESDGTKGRLIQDSDIIYISDGDKAAVKYLYRFGGYYY